MREIILSPYFILYFWGAYVIIGILFAILFYCGSCFVYKRYYEKQSHATFEDFVVSEDINFGTLVVGVAWLPMLFVGLIYFLILVPAKYLCKRIGKLIRNIFKI